MQTMIPRPLLAGLVFAAVTGAASAQTETAILTASDAELLDSFGWDVDFDGDLAIVGAPSADGALLDDTGAAYVFERTPAGWVEVQKLLASDGASGDGFGVAVARDGEWAAVSTLPASLKGAVYLFQDTGGGWVERQRLTVRHKADFAVEVALDGGRLMVGAQTGFFEGRVRVYELIGGTWVGVTVFDAYCGRLDLEGDRVLGGAGSFAATYVRVGASWVEEQLLGGECCHTAYGWSVALEGNRLLVGNPYTGFDTANFEAHAFSGGAWSLVQTAFKPEPESVAVASSLAMEGSLVAMGDAWASGWSSLPTVGAGYLYRYAGGTWNVAGKLTPSDGTEGDLFGFSIALSGTTVVVGAPQFLTGAGKAYVYETTDVATSFCACDAGAACANEYPIGGCANARELGAVLGASGSASVTADDLVLSAVQLPAGQFGIVFMGDAQVPPVVLADGLRCVGGALFRYPARATGAGGTFDEGPGIVLHSQTFAAPGNIAAGQTWHFQAWVRDPSGPCGNGSNLSNALSVTFTP